MSFKFKLRRIHTEKKQKECDLIKIIKKYSFAALMIKLFHENKCHFMYLQS